MMSRPRLKLKPERIDRFLELIGFAALFLLIVLPVLYFDQLPDEIPRHFDASGTPDAYSGKAIVWILPLIGTLMFAGMFWLSKRPHIYNYPQKVTEENAENIYRAGSRMVQAMNTLITCAFAYITYSTIRISLGSTDGLGEWFLPVFLLLIFGFMGYFIVKMMSAK